MASGVRVRAFTICSPGPARSWTTSSTGLSRPQKALPPKYFYDERGSRAVRRDLRAARVLPDAHRDRDACARTRATWRRASGRSARRRSSTAAAAAARRASCMRGARAASPTSPIDIAGEQLHEASSAALAAAISRGCAVVAVCADYTRPLVLPDAERRSTREPARRLFSRLDHRQLHARRRRWLSCRTRARSPGAGGGMLDRGRSEEGSGALLHAAYNDAQGVTARIQPEPARAHQSRARRRLRPARVPSTGRTTTPAAGRIEMHLVSAREPAA